MDLGIGAGNAERGWVWVELLGSQHILGDPWRLLKSVSGSVRRIKPLNNWKKDALILAKS